MAVEKKILRNRPFQGANAQYNFEDGSNIGIDPYGKLDVESDLYTTSIGNETNEYNILGTSMFGLGEFRMWELNHEIVMNSDNIDIRIGFIDGEQFPQVMERFQISEEGFLNYYIPGLNATKTWEDDQGELISNVFYFELLDGRMRAGNAGVDLLGGFQTAQDESFAEALIARYVTASGYGGDDSVHNLTSLSHVVDQFEWNGYPSSFTSSPRNSILRFQYFPYMTNWDDYDYFEQYYSDLFLDSSEVPISQDALLFEENNSSNESSADENAYATPKQWYNSENLSDTQTRINTSAFYNSITTNLMTGEEKENQNPKDSFYIIVHNNAANFSNNEPREEAFVIFRIPKYVFADAWNDVSVPKRVQFIRDGDNSSTSESFFDPYDDSDDNIYTFPCPPNFRTGGDEDAPAIQFYNSFDGNVCAEFRIQKYPEEDITLNQSTLPFYNMSGVVSENNLLGASPFNTNTYSIGTMSTDIPEEERGLSDFRPLTNVYSSQEMDLQSYYLDELDRNQTAAPTQVNLGFDFVQNKNLFTPMEITDFNEFLQFKAFVVNWDWRDGESETWEQIMSDFPKTEPELELKRNQDNTYRFINLSLDNTSEELNNFYQTAGFKIIKAIVVSYYDYGTTFPEFDMINVLRWKLLTIKINLSVDAVYLEDFGDIGGFDYTFIPWPETTPVIGGLSEESIYVNTLESLVKQNKFRQDEILDKTLAQNALQNDELGDYFGKSDIAQTRYFTDGSFDMNKLLMLGDDLLITDDGDGNIFRDEFHPYYDYNYWTGESITSSYPQESCIGTLFINDNMNQDLREKILIELNTDDIDERTIRDSSGNGFKGLILGDYAVRKDSKDIRIQRDTQTILPEVDTEEKAF